MQAPSIHLEGSSTLPHQFYHGISQSQQCNKLGVIFQVLGIQLKGTNHEEEAKRARNQVQTMHAQPFLGH